MYAGDEVYGDEVTSGLSSEDLDDGPLTDALSICNGCDMAEALPDSQAGYCATCEREAQEQTEAIEGGNR